MIKDRASADKPTAIKFQPIKRNKGSPRQVTVLYKGPEAKFDIPQLLVRDAIKNQNEKDSSLKLIKKASFQEDQSFKQINLPFVQKEEKSEPRLDQTIKFSTDFSKKRILAKLDIGRSTKNPEGDSIPSVN